MRLAVDAPSLGDTALVFERANQSAAVFHQALVGRLSRCGAMAGDASIASEFAASYDEAAAVAVDALADLVDAFATCGRLTRTTLANHARAEARSVISGSTVYEGSMPSRGHVSVLATTLPSALGGDPSSLPGWANWILDQVEGFVWPDADVDRLRAAASAWRAASTSVADLTGSCDTAVSSLLLNRSPEVPVAVEVTERLAGSCASVSDECAALAQACEQYADHVEAQRAAILDLLHDLLRDAVIIQGIGIVLGAVTGGITAAGAAAINTAKIAAAAPRLIRIVSTLRSLASLCAAPLRLTATTLGGVRRDLAVFRRAKVTLASTTSAERSARVARVKGIVRHPGLFDPEDLRGLSPTDIREICQGWLVRDSSKGQGVVYIDPFRKGRQIRVMEPYPTGTRPDSMTDGFYAVVSQNNPGVKIPLMGNPTL